MANLFLLLLACAVSVWHFFELAWFCWRGTRAVGHVVKLAEQESSEGGPVYVPVVEYRAGGQIFRIQPPGFMSPARYQVGEEVPVYYFTSHPGQGRLVTTAELLQRFVIAAVFVFVAAMLLRSISTRHGSAQGGSVPRRDQTCSQSVAWGIPRDIRPEWLP